MYLVSCVLVLALILFLVAPSWPRTLWRAGNAAARGPARKPAPVAEAEVSARWIVDECPRLREAGAGWEAILPALDPRRDIEVATRLARIRAAHPGDARAGLDVIERGCLGALEQNDQASAIDGLTAAVRTLQPLPIVRW